MQMATGFKTQQKTRLYLVENKVSHRIKFYALQDAVFTYPIDRVKARRRLYAETRYRFDG